MGTRFLSVAFGVTKRHLRKLLKNPELSMPPLVMPLLFFAAFAGGLSAISKAPGFDYPDYTGFEFVFALFLSAAFCGVFAAFSLADDFDSGFAGRLMVAAPQRFALVLGYVLAALVQALVSGLILFGVGVAAGMDLGGSVLQIVGIFALALIFNLAATLFEAGVALRLRSVQAAPLMQMPVFILMFLTPVYTLRPLLTGWVEKAASANPITPLLEASRGLLAGDPVSVVLAFASVTGMVALFAVWATLGMRKAERSI